MSPNESTAPSGRRPRRRKVLGSGTAIIVGSLLIGGLTTYAAATASASSQFVSPGTSASSASVTPGTTTTTAPQASQNVDATSAIGSPGIAATQTIGIAVLPGTLTVTPSTQYLSLTQSRDYSGPISPITVDDARGSLVGWRSTVSLQAVSGLDATQLASTRLCVSPHPTTLVAGNPADIVRSSPRACASPGDPITVFSAAPGGGGGEYSDTASIALVLPGGTNPASVTASFTVAVG